MIGLVISQFIYSLFSRFPINWGDLSKEEEQGNGAQNRNGGNEEKMEIDDEGNQKFRDVEPQDGSGSMIVAE